MYKGSSEILHRALSRGATISRVPDPVHGELVSDPSVLEPLVEDLIISSMQVPTELDSAKKHARITAASPSTLSIRSRLGSPHQLLDDLWPRSGGEEVYFQAISISLIAEMGYGIHTPADSSRAGGSWIDFYQQHDVFFGRVLQEVHLDMIYRPDPGWGVLDPRVTTTVDLPIVFRDVPIDQLVPRLRTISSGEKEWGMVRLNEPETGVTYTASEYAAMCRPDRVAGELLED